MSVDFDPHRTVGELMGDRPPQTSDEVGSLLNEAVDAIVDGRKINAIKALRSIRHLGLGLKAAKDVVDTVGPQRDWEQANTVLREVLAGQGLQLSTSPDWEHMSAELWRFATALLAADHEAGPQVQWLAEQFDELVESA